MNCNVTNVHHPLYRDSLLYCLHNVEAAVYGKQSKIEFDDIK